VIPRSVQEFFGDPYFARLTQGIAGATNQYDYTFSLFLIDSLEVEDRIIPRITRSGMIDGIILQSTFAADKVLSRVINGTLPYVIAGRPLLANNHVNYIDVDNERGAMMGVEHLIKLGRRRIASIIGPQNISPGYDRKQGYKKMLARHNLPVDQKLMVDGNFTELGGYEAAMVLLGQNPDAIFVASDLMAIGAMRAIKEQGLRIPEDIAIVSYDDLPPARYAEPQLTTIRQPVLRFGVAAVDMLLSIIEGRLGEHQKILDVELIIRDSCGANL
jgi:LacI family transcriptional regulator